MEVPFGLAFAAGLLAAFNPCGFALLPAYLSYFVGTDGASAPATTSSTARGIGRAVVVSTSVTAGFAVVFGALGLVVTLASLQVSSFAPWLTVAIGFVLAGLGVAMIRGYEPKLSLPKPRSASRRTGLPGYFVFGLSYATVSLSCTLAPFLATVAGTFQEASLAGGMATFGAYTAGMGAVLAVLTVAVALAERRLINGMRRALPYIHRLSGGLLVVAGAYVVWYGTYELLQNAGYDVNAGPVAFVTDISGRISRIVGDVGATRIGVASVVLVASAGAAALATRRRVSR